MRLDLELRSDNVGCKTNFISKRVFIGFVHVGCGGDDFLTFALNTDDGWKRTIVFYQDFVVGSKEKISRCTLGFPIFVEKGD